MLQYFIFSHGFSGRCMYDLIVVFFICCRFSTNSLHLNIFEKYPGYRWAETGDITSVSPPHYNITTLIISYFNNSILRRSVKKSTFSGTSPVWVGRSREVKTVKLIDKSDKKGLVTREVGRSQLKFYLWDYALKKVDFFFLISLTHICFSWLLWKLRWGCTGEMSDSM